MASTVCTSVAKFLMVATGVVYLFSAAGLMYIGVWVFDSYSHYDKIADSTLTLLPASIILAVSAFMLIIGLLACIAACKNNKILLAVFFSLVVLVLIGEVMAGTLGYVYRSKVEKILDDDLSSAVNQYNVTVNQEQIDYMQSELGCCGVHNYTDWEDSPAWGPRHNKTVPKSCCMPLSGNATCDPTFGSKDIYPKGCLDQLEDKFRDNLIWIAGSVVLLAVIQLVALISTCVLVCRTREQSVYQILGEPVGGGLRV